MFELKGYHRTTRAPGCTRADGGVYRIKDDIPLAPFPDALVDWVEANAPKKESSAGAAVAEDFDFDDHRPNAKRIRLKLSGSRPPSAGAREAKSIKSTIDRVDHDLKMDTRAQRP